MNLVPGAGLRNASMPSGHTHLKLLAKRACGRFDLVKPGRMAQATRRTQAVGGWNGLMTGTPKLAKSATLRVTTVSW